ncbi:MAG TPA: LysM peptidoglycan-binding domain-containing protein [Methylophilaceae bacterium]
MPIKAPIHLMFALVLFCVTAYADGTPDQGGAGIPPNTVQDIPQDTSPDTAQDQPQASSAALPPSLTIPQDVVAPDDLPQADSDSTSTNQTAQTGQNASPAAPAVAAVPNDLWQRIRNGYGMTNLQSPFTATHEAWYAARPEYVQRMVSRSQLYLYHVVEEVQKRGMPTEIALLPMVESAFNPEAYSRSKASGMWQFIPSTGKNFGLKQDWWSDNRRDVMAATDAALNYLNKLHGMFGTWELALAAYNAGEGTVQRAIDVNRRKGLPTDYQSLNLPAETREYVPKLQAVKNIISNPQQYGLDIKSIANQPYFTRVNVPNRMDVKIAAKLAGVSTAEFTQLNPAHRRPVLAGGSQSILLPIGKEGTFETNLANYNQPLVTWQTHYAKRGERLSSIAKKYGITVAQLQEANDISAKKRLQSNQPLLVPAPQGGATTKMTDQDVADAANIAANLPKETSSTTSKRYLVKKGDTVVSIAKNNGITTKQLMAFNHLKSNKLHHGQSLVVNQVTSTQVASIKKVTGNKIATASSPAKPSKVAAKTTKTRYVVKRGETLASIARKFNVDASDLQRWNKINHNRITAGHALTIYRPDDA